VYSCRIDFEVNMFVGDGNEVSFSKSVGTYALTDWVVYLSQTAAGEDSIHIAVGTSSSCAVAAAPRPKRIP